MEGKIYSQIAEIMNEIGAVKKDDWNSIQKFKFRGIDAVMNALHPALSKHHVFVVPEVLEQTREERKSKNDTVLIYSICKIRYTFYADDGSSVSAVVIGEGMDSGDKATNKAMAIALKYAFFQVFCIPTEEMTDPDADSPEVKAKTESKQEPKDTRIGEAKVNTIRSICQRDGIDVAALCGLYKVKAPEEMTETQFKNVLDHWDKVLEMYGKKK